MPRGDGTGPWGTGPIGRGLGGCQSIGFGFGFGSGFGQRRGLGFAPNIPAAPSAEAIETQAERLEAQAAYLRNLAKQNHKAE